MFHVEHHLSMKSVICLLYPGSLILKRIEHHLLSMCRLIGKIKMFHVEHGMIYILKKIL